MALINPNNLYKGDAVVVNSTPYVQFALQQQAKEKAKKDALDQYYSKALSDVTPAGMRQKDVEGGFSKKLDEWKAFGMNPENRKRLRNPALDGYKTLTEFNRRHQDLLYDATKSKERLKKEEEIFKLKQSGKWNPTDDDMGLVTKISSSIYDINGYDEDGKEPDLMQLSINVPEFDPNMQKQFFEGAVGGRKAKRTPDESKAVISNGYIKTPWVEKFDDATIKAIGDDAGRLFEGSKPAKVFFEKQLKDPDFTQTMGEAYDAVYGKGTFQGTPKQAAQAAAILRASAAMDAGVDERVDIEGQRRFQREQQERGFANQRKMAALRNAYSKGLVDYKAAKSEKEQENVLNTFVNNQYEAGDKKIYKISIGGKEYNGRMIDMPKSMAEKYTIEKGMVRPIGFYITHDKKKIIPVYPQTDKYYNIQKTPSGNYLIDAKNSTPIDIQSYKAELSQMLLPMKNRGDEVIEDIIQSESDIDGIEETNTTYELD